ncbi:hypothetical protein VP01_2304g4 [Puccinia sorghi]|uniref:Uncharacterized protein n=1 Tax=Puccinia sorghi TaxID=27349 RepID=A0A0L6V7U1_9BASI|nr:hypothetical protein VP01_2304g4 [Puccinia sorghi]
MLYMSTRDVVREPANYDPCGRPPKLQKEELDFILSILEADPTLYLDGMPKQHEEATGKKVALSTIHNTTVKRLHAEQCPTKQAQNTINISLFPAQILVFTADTDIWVYMHNGQKCRVHHKSDTPNGLGN